VECIIPGIPVQEWPWYYIDPDTCIDCGACVPECPFEAIFPEDEVPADYPVAKEGVQISRNDGTEVFDGHDDKGDAVHVEGVRTIPVGETVDLRPDIQPNYDYFKEGPGYKAIGK
jgi:ferredoxin